MPIFVLQIVTTHTKYDKNLKWAGPQARAVVELRTGAQVILIRNISQKRSLVNGARGVVLRFQGSTNPLPVVQFASVRFCCKVRLPIGQ